MERICLHPLSFCPCMHFFFFLFHVSILLIIHECPLSLPLLSPPLSFPVAIFEPTTTSAVSSPGQYMSPCCTPDQQRGPLPHANLSPVPPPSFWFISISWLECLLGVQLHCIFFFIYLFAFMYIILTNLSLASCTYDSLCHCNQPLPSFLTVHYSTHPPSLGEKMYHHQVAVPYTFWV